MYPSPHPHFKTFQSFDINLLSSGSRSLIRRKKNTPTPSFWQFLFFRSRLSPLFRSIRVCTEGLFCHSYSSANFQAYTPFKKCNATRVWSIIFLLSWIYIQIRYTSKACLFAFRLMPYLLGLFHWGVCRVSKLGAMSKGKVAKVIGLYGKCMLCHVLCFPFVSVQLHAYTLPIHSTEILRNKTCWILFCGAILEHLFFDIASIILYTVYISRWFNFRDFREPLIAKIFTLTHVYLH